MNFLVVLKVNSTIFCSPIGWSGQGCHVKSMDDSKTECTCNHLTHFAVLMQFNSKSTGNKDNSISKVSSRRMIPLHTVMMRFGLYKLI